MTTAHTTRGRVVRANTVILDQFDFFLSDGFSRAIGLIPSDLVSHLFFNNVIQPWPLISGDGVTDAQVVSGNIYMNEISSDPGFYNIRFRPNMLGYWRNMLSYPAGKQILAQDFDVKETAPQTPQGLTASFVRPSDGCGCST